MRLKVTVRLYGGIGNQLFQYFAGLNLSLNYDADFVIDFRWLEYENAETISKFQFVNDFGQSQYSADSPFHYKQEKSKTAVVRRIPLLGRVTGLHVPKHPFFIEFERITRDIELRGYYQSYKYFEDTQSFIFPNKFSWNLVGPGIAYTSLINNELYNDFIAVHIRGTDYLNNVNYESITADYYARNIQKSLGDLDATPPIIVFSDDIDHALKIMNTTGVDFIFAPPELDAVETLSLMSKAKLLISANSTFSYWGGLINPRLRMVVPKYWFSEYALPSDFYPNTWEISD